MRPDTATDSETFGQAAVRNSFLKKPFSILPIFLFIAKSGDPFEINKVTITPDPPVKGQGLTVVANITFGE